MRVLRSLNRSTYPVHEVIVVDSGDDAIGVHEFEEFKTLKIDLEKSERSVCVQRNIGIKKAKSEWIFLCDDDLEVTPEYLHLLADAAKSDHRIGALSGVVLQIENNKWEGQYAITSSRQLLWRFIFQLSIWGEINCASTNWFVRSIKDYYRKRGNHISPAGWPVMTDFSGEHFKTPVYGLGASLIKKEWLLHSLYDEVLDPHGIGDNYGVAIGFPIQEIHVISKASVHHHQAPDNRLSLPTRYFRRTLALDYFIRTRKELKDTTTLWFAWSLFGNLIAYIFSGKRDMVRAAIKSLTVTVFKRNPYFSAAKRKERIIEPSI
jgi:glycosyltransferase involved in cell wall biosynthesis